MTPELIERIAQTAAEKAVKVALPEALRLFGVDADNPIAVQRDMAHLRAWRLAVERTRSAGILAVMTTLVTGIGGAVWYAIKH